MGETDGSKRKLVVGLTGGIGSGKSTVSKELRRLGAGVVDADLLAREVVAPGSEGLAEVVAAFGEGVLDKHGGLDRAKVGELVFGDGEARAKLVAITHPRIARLSMERLAALAATDCPYVIYEAPLLIESGAHRGMDVVVVVATGPDVQVRRIADRDGLSADAAQARIDAQAPLQDKLAVADHVIENDGTLQQLLGRTREVHEAILARS